MRVRMAVEAPFHALADTARVPALARVQGAWALLSVATWTYTVALTVYAFRAGGAAGVALAVLVRTLPAAALAPALGTLADRLPRVAVMAGAGAITAAAVGVTVLAEVQGAPPGPVYALGAVVTAAGMAFRASQSAAMPALASDTRELTAANVVTSGIESAAVFAGPLLAAVLLALGGPGLGFAVAAGLAAAATAIMAGLRGGQAARGPARSADDGLRAAVADPVVRTILVLLLAQTIVSGALSVYYALAAIDLLDMGESGVGLLTAAYGAGGLLGSAAAFTLIGSRRLVAPMTAGMLLWGVPLVLVGALADPVAAVVLLLAVGIGNVLFDVTTVTLLQRSVPDGILARVFGTLELVVVLGLGLGAALAPLLADQLGIRGALVATGAILPVAALLAAGALRRASRGSHLAAEELAVLRRVALFAGLPGPVLENLALHAGRRHLPAGARVMTQGEPGDVYYAIAAGRLRVTIDGVPVAELGAGQGAGEIALLRDVPRIATVDVIEDAELLTIERVPFLAAVTGHAGARDDANAIVAAHMAAARLGRRTV